MIDEKPPIGAEEVAEATAILQKYKAGKAALDKRIVDNELWFRMGHWKNYQNPMMEGKPQPSSGWLFNSIANKHADAMDNYPSPNVLPRAEDDEAAAQALSSVLPVVLEQADYEQVYSDTWWRKLKQGTGVKGVFWDPEQRGGVGEIAIRPMNLLMLYWEPGVDDIQESPHFFSLSLADSNQLEERWPQLAGHTASVLDVPHYIHDSGLDTSDKSVVVDWYYKKLSPEGRSVLHYCKFCNGVVLYASENDPQYALSKACADYLAQQTDAKGRKLEVTLLPIPQKPVCITQEECSELDLWDGEPTRTAGERLAASYVNFYIANDSVLVPQFGDPMDKTACEILSAQFPNRTIVPIAAREILLGGGNIHCITQQIPLGRSSIYA